MSSYAEALSEFYNGEVYGETMFSALVGLARNADERLKWSMLLQLETETKAWLRAPMVAHGVSIEERTADRDNGLARARERASLPWPQAMQFMYDRLSGHYVPLYQSFADAARARGEAGEQAVCLYMVEHEKALVEFTRRELAGASLAESLEPILKCLKYPIKLRASGPG
ncbi:MAG TPA: hypothetical protein VKI44_25625 [Acetobacteraceae bacterium]|nr:hypothetical protein [Acetobacteraceae bacterium]